MRVIPIIKAVSHSCNLRCIYCYYHQENQNRVKVMSAQVLESLISKTISEIDGVKHFVWHGGEPLLAGIEFYEKVIELQDYYKQKNQIISNGVQTNATLITDAWARFLKTHRFNVGISCDGPRNYHNSNRIDANGGGTFDRVFQGIATLKQYNFNPMAISVITKNSLRGVKEIFDFFYENKISFHPKPCHEFDTAGKLTEFSVTPMEYTRFLIELFELWFKYDNPAFQIRYLNNLIKAIIGGKPNLCEFCDYCHIFLTVDCNGNVGPCDSFPLHKLNFGNILRDSWKDILNSSAYRLYLDYIQENKSRCGECKWRDICQGGCLRYFSGGKDQSFREESCEARKILFSYAEHKIKNTRVATERRS